MKISSFKNTCIAGIAAVVISGGLFSCDFISSLSGNDVANGLKEALRVSSDTSVSQLNRTNGYYGDLAVKIMLPGDVQQAANIPGLSVVLQPLAETLIKKMNQAAETAAKDATPILLNAITSITFTDAMDILKGENNAATQYLRSKTFTGLKSAFQPHIEDALELVGAQQAWSSITTPIQNFGLPVETDLAAFTTEKALDGLFYKVAIEEGKIRTDVNHQVTDLLRKVFGDSNSQ